MIFRPQRSGLAESMGDAVSIIPPTLVGLAAFLGEPAVGDIEVDYYGYDDRIDWQTYVVKVRGCAVGFTNQEVFNEIRH